MSFFFETEAFKYSCLAFQGLMCLVAIPAEVYVVAYKTRFKLDISAYIILVLFTLSFVARLVIYALDIKNG